MSDLYDVIVVGAGPAGSMAAKICAENGLNTILLDKQVFPRDKPCAGGVSRKALNLIGEPLPGDLIENHIKGFRLYSPAMECAELRSADYVGITTRRSKFDAFLADLAVKKGAVFLQNTKVTDCKIGRDTVQCQTGNNNRIEGKILIGADGAHGFMAKKTGMRDGWNLNEIGICAEATVSLEDRVLDTFPDDTLQIFFSDVKYGYGWVFPKRNSVSIGCGCKFEPGIKIRDVFKKFCDKISRYYAIPFSPDEYNTHITPSGGFRRKISSERVLLAGDAAGFIDPITGEGISYALQSGLIAAGACCKAAENNDYSSRFFKNNYDLVCENEFNKDLRTALRIAQVFHTDPGFFLHLLKNYSGEGWAEFTTGKRKYRDITPAFLPRYFAKKLF